MYAFNKCVLASSHHDLITQSGVIARSGWKGEALLLSQPSLLLAACERRVPLLTRFQVEWLINIYLSLILLITFPGRFFFACWADHSIFTSVTCWLPWCCTFITIVGANVWTTWMFCCVHHSSCTHLEAFARLCEVQFLGSCVVFDHFAALLVVGCLCYHFIVSAECLDRIKTCCVVCTVLTSLIRCAHLPWWRRFYLTRSLSVIDKRAQMGRTHAHRTGASRTFHHTHAWSLSIDQVSLSNCVLDTTLRQSLGSRWR